MRVDLCRRDVGVTEQLLDDTQVGAAGEQVGREAVAELVRVDVAEVRQLGVATHDLPHRDTLERAARVRQQQS